MSVLTMVGLICATFVGIIAAWQGVDFLWGKIRRRVRTRDTIDSLPAFMDEMRDFKTLVEKELTHNGGGSMKDWSLETRKMLEEFVRETRDNR